MKWLLGGAGFLLGLMGSRFEDALTWLVLGFMAGGFLDFRRAARKSTDGDELARVKASLEQVETRLTRLESTGFAPAPPHPADAAESVAAPAMPAEPVTLPADVAAARLAPAAEVPGAPDGIEIPLQEPTEPTEPTEPALPMTPPRPSPFGVALAWFTGGNTVVKVGIVVLFFGVAFLIKYAADNALLPIQLRLAGVTLAAIVALWFGWRLAERHRPGATSGAPVDDPAGDLAGEEAAALARIRHGYGLLLQGTAIGLLYLTVFGAFRLYGLLPGGLAFALMCAIVLFAAVLAVRQDSLALAAFGSAGGFLAPLLASTGGGSHVGLFSFYLLLDAGIVAIAWFKAWRVLNLLGFAFTFGIAALWGASAYRPAHFASTEPFLAAFFVLFVAVTVLFARRRAPVLASTVDGTLVFGTPIVGFGLQAALVQDMPFGAAWSAVAVSAFYLGLAAALRERTGMRLLFECFVALGVVFATLAVPLALDGRWTSAAWALEGAAVIWVGMRQSRLPARGFGYLVMAGAALAFLVDDARWRQAGDWPLANAACLGRLLIALAALFVARLIDRSAARLHAAERALAPAWMIWGCLWWLIAGIAETDRWLEDAHSYNAAALFMAASAALAFAVARRRDWPRLDGAVLALLPLLCFTAFMTLEHNRHPFAAWGALEWPLALAIHLWLLHRLDRRADAGGVRAPPVYHAIGIWLVTVLAVAELHHLTDRAALASSVWSASAAALPLVAMVLWLGSARAARLWPVARHPRAVLVTGLAPLIALGWAWIFYADWRYDGQAGPIAYLPILNALDLTHLFVIAAFVVWWRALARAGLARPAWRAPLAGALGAAVFFWLNAVLLRTVHHWGGVPYRFDALMGSTLVQAALSIFWTVLALSMMVIAHRRALRAPWLAGAALLAATVAKLFIVDLSNIGGIERIVSFIGVGVLMLGVGYFSPLPPKRRVTEEPA